MEANLNLNMDRICRVCLQETTNKKPLTCKNDGDHRTLREILSFVSSLDILLASQVPTDICYNCEDVLRKADAFKRCCQEAEAIFQTILDDSHFTVKKLNVKNEFKNKLESDTQYASSKTRNQSTEETNLPVNKIEELLKKSTIINNLEFEDGFDVNFDSSGDEASLSIKQETEEPIKPYICLCRAQFDNQNDFHTHQNTNKCKVALKNELDIFDPDVIDTNNLCTNLDLTCPTCRKEFDSIDDSSKHKCRLKKSNCTLDKPKQMLTCDLCLRQFATKKNLQRHLKRHKQKQSEYICTICNREFLFQGSLDKHVLSQHSKEKCLSCNICPKVFTTKEGLSYHIKAHNGKKKHECKICGKVFVMISTLKDHFRTHTGEKPFLCSVCGKGFSQKNNLGQHMRRHMGLKPFKCGSCDQSFVSKGELDSHTRKHTGAHPFICDICKNGFTSASSLVKHKRTHTGERPYACDLCPMKFAASGTLVNHRRTHTGEKPYQCSLCDRAFVQRQDLVSHIRCHTGERPYVCVDCGQSFRKNSALKMHSKIHLDPMTKLQLSGVQV